MNRHSGFTLACIVVVALVAVYVGYELAAFAASSSSTANLTISRRRVHPGETVEFGLKLVDSQGRSKSFPRSGRPPQLVLEDAQGQNIGTYNFRFG